MKNGREAKGTIVLQDGHLIDIGLKMEKLVGTTNNALEGLITSSYIYSIYIMIVFSFQLLSNVFSNAVHTAENKLIWLIGIGNDCRTIL